VGPPNAMIALNTFMTSPDNVNYFNVPISLRNGPPIILTFVNMANAASNVAQKLMGDATSELASTPEISNPSKNPAWADPSGEKMKALAWFGKNNVQVIESFKPAIVDPSDVIVKVTGTTICGSDLHLYHGSIIQMQKGDILGYWAPRFL